MKLLLLLLLLFSSISLSILLLGYLSCASYPMEAYE